MSSREGRRAVTSNLNWAAERDLRGVTENAIGNAVKIAITRAGKKPVSKAARENSDEEKLA
jgi:hypothetical protein